MGAKSFLLNFTSVQIGEPIVYELGRQFDLVTNIRRASISKDEGWVLLDLEGDDDQIQKAVEWAQARGVAVEPVTGDLSYILDR